MFPAKDLVAGSSTSEISSISAAGSGRIEAVTVGTTLKTVVPPSIMSSAASSTVNSETLGSTTMAYDSAVPNAASSLSDTSGQPTNSSDGRPNSSTLSRISVTNDEQSALPTETHSECLSSGAKIGLAADVPCGILILIAIGAGAYLFLNAARPKR